MSAVCTRCAEPLVQPPPDGLCVWCREELGDSVVEALAGPRPARTFAVWDLLGRGYPAAAVVAAVRVAKAGGPVEDVAAQLAESAA